MLYLQFKLFRNAIEWLHTLWNRITWTLLLLLLFQEFFFNIEFCYATKYFINSSQMHIFIRQICYNFCHRFSTDRILFFSH